MKRTLLISFMLVCSTAMAQIITSGLVGWYRFDEAKSGTCSGASVKDSSTQGNTGTCNNTPSWVAGKIGIGTMSFNGTNQYISTADIAADHWANLRTFTFWINPAATGQTRPRILDEDNGTDAWAVWLDQGGSCGFVNSICVIFGTTPGGLPTTGVWSTPANSISASTGVWTHVVVVTDGTNVTAMYINGVSQTVNTTTENTGNLSAVAGFLIGAGVTGGRYFSGSIDEVRLYSQALSAQDVKTLFQYTGNNLGFWKMVK